MQQLLADVEAGKVDVIVVYKVDRLTRSLADFAKIVEILDKRGASFVSVTQSFNTTTSMGRLTLNVLLSFAQFEREVTGERIRDKIAASKAKGMWMGGPAPLGYEVKERNLVIDEVEAETVRHVYQRYAELRSIGALVDELARSHHRTKRRFYKDGRIVGGIMFQKGPLAWLLQNRIYLGEIVHKGAAAPGRHSAIIPRELFEQVQAIMAANRHERLIGSRSRQPSLLTGILFDASGRPMTPVHTTRGSRRYRYYVSRVVPGDAPELIVRIPAGDIERLVVEMLRRHLRDHATLVAGADQDGSTLHGQIVERDEAAGLLVSMTISQQRETLLKLAPKVTLLDDRVQLQLKPPTAQGDEASFQLESSACLVNRGSDVRLAIAPENDCPRNDPDPVLLKLIVHAHAARKTLVERKPGPMVSGYSDGHLGKLLRLSYLAPDIVTAIVEGNQPANLTGRRLLRAGNLPLAWAEQRRLFGFA